jgi:hypothetical protein
VVATLALVNGARAAPGDIPGPLARMRLNRAGILGPSTGTHRSWQDRSMRLDPAQWSERLQTVVLLVVFATYGLSAMVGPRGGPVVMGWFAAALGVLGGLTWRYSAVPWREIASWTLPLTAWMVGLVYYMPARIPAIAAFLLACVWFALFVSWSPLVGWWYRSVLRKPLPPSRRGVS